MDHGHDKNAEQNHHAQARRVCGYEWDHVDVSRDFPKLCSL